MKNSTSKYSIITICKYCEYQEQKNTSDKQATSKRQASDNKQEGKEGKEVKEEAKASVGQPEETAPRLAVKIPYSEIIKMLNEKAGTQFKANAEITKRHIKARWNEGFRLQDFITVIEAKFYEWSTDAKMCQYLRPQTLFGTKFESYLQNAVIADKPRNEKVYTLPDLDELRKRKQAAKQQAGEQ